jgi:diadenosine tetraphosphatase ApaH/serine/threonine PP2A family protein phosphatase
MGMLRSLENCWMIRGNTDDYLVKFADGTAPAGLRMSHQWAATRWSYQHLEKDHLNFVAALPAQAVVRWRDTAPIRVVHGTPASSAGHLYPDHDVAIMEVFKRAMLISRNHVSVDDALAQVNEPVLICGHSHIGWQQERAGRLVVNPGSVGAPINGDPRAQYALLTWRDGRWHAELRALSYDWVRTRANYADSGLLEAGGGMARAFLLNAETGRNIAGELLAHAYRLAADAGLANCDVVPDAIWDRAVVTFDWDAAAKI